MPPNEGISEKQSQEKITIKDAHLEITTTPSTIDGKQDLRIELNLPESTPDNLVAAISQMIQKVNESIKNRS